MKTTGSSAIVALTLGILVSPGSAQPTLPFAGSVSQAGEVFRVDNTYAGATRSYDG